MTDFFARDTGKFFKTSDLAKKYGYTPDYLAKLCRDGVLNCYREGKQWFVDSDSVEAFSKLQLLKKEARRKKLSNDLKHSHKESDSTSSVFSQTPTQAPLRSNYNIEKIITDKIQTAEKFTKDTLTTTAGDFVQKALALALAGAITASLFVVDGDVIASSKRLGNKVAQFANSLSGFKSFSFDDALQDAEHLLQNPDELQSNLASAFSPVDFKGIAGFLSDRSRAVFSKVQDLFATESMFSFSGSGASSVSVQIKELPVAQEKLFAKTAPKIKKTFAKAQPTVTNIKYVIEPKLFDTLEAKNNLQKLERQLGVLSDYVYELSLANKRQVKENFRSIALTQKIDQLHDVDISDAVIDNSVIKNSTIQANSLTVTGTTTLSNAVLATLSVSNNLNVGGDINTSLSQGIAFIDSNGTLKSATGTPNTILKFDSAGNGFAESIFQDDGATATTSGNFVVTGTTTLNYLSVLNSVLLSKDLTVSGTSTLATTSITSLAVSGNTTLNTFSANAGTTTNATSTNLYAQNFKAENATTTNANTTNLTAQNATSTNLYSQNATFSGATSTNLYSQNANFQNATTTNFAATDANLTNATSTNFFASALSAINATISNTITALKGVFTDFIAQNATTTNLIATNATATNLTVQNLRANLPHGFVFRGDVNNQTEATGSLYIADSGNIGIGTTSPGQKLHVMGDAWIGDGDITPSLIVGNAADITNDALLYFRTTGNGLLQVSNGGKFVFRDASYNEYMAIDTTSGNVGIGVSSPNARLHVRGGDVRFDDASNNTQLFFDQSTGRLGLGTTNPSYKLDVNGDINIASGSKLKIGGNDFAINNLADAQKDTTNYNLFFGQAGFTGTFYNTYNTAIGIGAFDNPNTDNTQSYYGDNNTAVGHYALTDNTTGYNNTAIGRSALLSNTTGYFNTANGAYALYSNTTGYYNTAIGRTALYYNTTGYSNTALGVNAGRYTNSGGNNETSLNSLYLGYDTRASASGNTNEIVIGAGARGNGSNSVTLGNDSIAKTILKGNVGIGLSSPNARLHVRGGDVRFEDASNNTQFFFDQSTGRLGIGTTNPSYKLDISGTLRATGAATLGSTLDVTGNTALGGTLGVTGATTLSNTLSVLGDTTLSSALSVSGLTSLATTTTSGPLTVNAQCVTADTRLRRRRRRKKGAEGDLGLDDDELEALKKAGKIIGYDDEYIYDEVNIVAIEAGDEVASLNRETGRFEYRRVNGIIPTGYQPLYRITTLTRRSIRTTATHPYLVRARTSAPKTQKKFRFEVDLSMKIESYAHDTIVAVANEEYAYTVRIGKQLKQTLRDTYRARAPKTFMPAVYALGIVEALSRMDAQVHELVIDTDYPSHEAVIARIIARYFPHISVHFTQVGKKSPAHYAAYGVHAHGKEADYTATLETFGGGKIESALPASFPEYKETGSESHQALSDASTLSGNDEFVNARWLPASELRVDMEIAVAHGNTPAWEKVVEIKMLSPESVWDIEIDGTHNFIGNDIIAHNTYLNGAAHLSGKLYDASGSEGANGQVLTSTGTSTKWATIGGSSITPDSLDFSEFKDTMTLDANTSIDMDTNSATLNFDNGTLFVDSVNNRVGVGTASPNERLEVATPSGGRGIFSDGGGASRKALLFEGPGSTHPTYGRIDAYDYGAGSALDLVLVNSGGNVGIGTTNPLGNLHIQDVSGDVSLYLQGGAANTKNTIYFREGATTNDRWAIQMDGVTESLNFIEDGTDSRLYLANGGNVGIGTLSPDQKLEVNGNILLQNNNEIRFRDSSGTQRTALMYTTSNDLEIWNSGGNGDVLFRNYGNVGIGTTNPSYKLDVSGTLRATGAAVLGSTLDVTGNTALGGTLGVTGATTLSNTLSVLGDTTLSSALSVSGITSLATTTASGPLTVNAQCVTADTRLRRRRRRKKGADDETGLDDDELEALKKAGKITGYDDEYIYDEVEIINIKEGDEIASLDRKTGKIVYRKVNAQMYMGKKPIFRLTTADGRSIRTTDNHPYLTKQGWKKVSELKEGEEIAVPVSKTRITYAFIDASNIIYGARSAGWKVDFAKLKKYLTQRYHVDKIFFYGGMDENNKKQAKFYEMLVALGYIVRLVPMKRFKDGKKKADCDARMSVEAMKYINECDSAIFMTGDGDFYWLMDEYKNANKDVRLLAFANRTAKELKRFVGGAFTDMRSLRHILERKENEKATDTLDVSVARVMPKVYTNDENSSSVAWVNIVNIEKLNEEDVYDVEIDGTHNFIGNDIVAHNTYLNGAVSNPNGNLNLNDNVDISGTLNATGLATFSSGVSVNGDTITDFTGTGLTVSSGVLSVSNVPASSLSLPHGQVFRGNASGVAEATSTLYIADSGNVGVGTTSPESMLSVAGNAIFGQGNTTGLSKIVIGETDLADKSFIVGYDHDNNYGYAQVGGDPRGTGLVIADAGNIGIGTTSPLYKLDVSGTGRFTDALALDSTLTVVGTSTLATTTVSGDFIADVNTLYVDSINNRVGVGTASPAAKLTVKDNSFYVMQVISTNTTGAGGGGIVIQPDDWALRSELSVTSDGRFRIWQNGDIFNIKNGNVGIGIGSTNPSNTLQVIGSARIGAGNQADLIIQTGTPAVSVGGSVTASIFKTTGTSTGAFHVGFEIPANDVDDGFYITTDANTDGTPDNVALKINALGNVGIGTTTPSYKLDVDGIARANRFRASGFDLEGLSGAYFQEQAGNPVLAFDATDYFVYKRSSDTLSFNSGGTLRLQVDSEGDIGIGGISNPLEKLHLNGALLVAGREPSANTIASTTLPIQGAYIAWNQEGGGGRTHFMNHRGLGGGGWQFDAFDGSGNYVDTPFIINGSGNVGIGTTTPSTKLHITGGTDTSLTGGGYLTIGNTSATNISIDDNEIIARNNGTAAPLYIQLNSGNTILNGSGSGNVGIGITVPSAKLDVNGSSYIRGYLRVGVDSIGGGGGAQMSIASGSSRFYIAPTDGAGSYLWGKELTFDPNGAAVWTAEGGFNITGDLTVDTNTLYVDSTNNRVGIGTVTPGAPLDVSGSGLIINAQSSGTDPARIRVDSSAGTGEAGLQIYTASTTVGSVVFNDGVDAGGIYYDHSANRMYFTQASAERMTISGGNVGIGTTNPAKKLSIYENNTGTSGQLTLEQNGTGDAGILLSLTGVKNWIIGVDNSDGDKFKIGNGNTIGGSNDLVIDSLGNVGIGTANPATKLEISNTSGTADLKLTGSGGNVIHQIASEYDINYTRNSGIAYMDFRAIPADGTSAAIYRFGLSSGSTGTNKIVLYEPNSTTIQTRLSSSGESSFINARGGNVGIGTTNPLAKLEVNTSGSPGTDGIKLKNSTDGHYVMLRPSMSAGANNSIVQAGDTGIIFTNGTQDTGAFVIAPWASGTSGIRMTSTGNVGIGTASPKQTLHINGNMILANGGQDIGVPTGQILQIGEWDSTYTTFTQRMQIGPNNLRLDTLGLILPNDTYLSFKDNTDTIRNVIKYDTANDLIIRQPLGNSIRLLTSGTERVTIDGSGNVGIGTTNPSAKLDVVGNTTLGGHLTVGRDGSLSDGAIEIISDNDSLSYIDFKGAGNESLDFVGRIRFDDTKGFAFEGGNVGIGTTSPGAKLDVSAAQSGYGAKIYNAGLGRYGLYVEAGGTATDKVFHFTGNPVAGYDMVMLQNGNVGIGTTNPQAKLDVEGLLRLGRINTTNEGGQVDFELASGLVGWHVDAYQNDFRIFNDQTNNPNGNIRLHTNGATRLFIDSAGSVGIGTTTPTAKLHVDGSARVSNGLLYLDGNYAGGNNIVFRNTDTTYYSGKHQWEIYPTGSSGGGLNFFDRTAGRSVLWLGESAGNVGIGTTNPTAKLEIVGQTKIVGAGGLYINQATAPLEIKTNPGAQDYATFSSTGYAGDIMTLNLATGNVGIGTTAPSRKLHVYDTNGTNAGAGYFHQSLTDQDTVNPTGINAYGTNNASVANARAAYGVVGYGRANPSAGITLNAQHMGVYGLGYNIGAGTVNSVSGVRGSVRNTGGGVINYGYGFYADCDGANNCYGLYVAAGDANVPVGNDWGVYVTGEDQNYFSGNVGIGTTNPSARLHINGGVKIEGTNTLEFGAGVAGKEANAGKIGYQTFSGDSLDIVGAGTPGNRKIRFYAEAGSSFDGNVGIGTTAPADKLHVAGDIRVGTGTTGCVKDADGTVIAGTCSSDEALKTDIQDLQNVLDGFANLRVIRYRWNELAADEYKYATSSIQLGVLAQNVEEFFPELVVEDAKGYKQVNYTGLSLYGLEAIKELNLKIESLASSTDTFADDQGFIAKIVQAVLSFIENLGIVFENGVAKFKQLAATGIVVGSQDKPNGITLYDEETGEAYCVKIRGGQMVHIPGECSSAGGAEGTEENGQSLAPSISINGNNPALVPLNSDFSDLGAHAKVIFDSEEEVSVVVYTFKDGALVSNVELDTSTSSVEFIDYVAVNGDKFATSTRVVLIGDTQDIYATSTLQELLQLRDEPDWQAMAQSTPGFGGDPVAPPADDQNDNSGGGDDVAGDADDAIGLNILGDNPYTLVATTSPYTDPGAEIVGTTTATLTVLVDGVEVSDLSSAVDLNISSTTTYNIVYQAVENDSVLASATREVIVVPNSSADSSQDSSDSQNGDGDGNASSTPDTQAPTITLLGEQEVNISIGDVYQDAGAQATDDVDGEVDVSAWLDGVEIVDWSVIDTSTTTTYTIEYRATDSAGNENSGEVYRTVNVVEAGE